MEEKSAYDMPELTAFDIVDKIEAYAWEIREDWTDPRFQVKEIARLSQRLKSMLNKVSVAAWN